MLLKVKEMSEAAAAMQFLTLPDGTVLEDAFIVENFLEDYLQIDANEILEELKSIASLDEEKEIAFSEKGRSQLGHRRPSCFEISRQRLEKTQNLVSEKLQERDVEIWIHRMATCYF